MGVCVCALYLFVCNNVQNLFLNLPKLSPTRIKTLAPTSLLGAHRGGLCLAHQLVLLAILLAFLLALLCGRLGLCRRLRRRRLLKLGPVLLQVRRHVLPRDPLDVHALHDGLGHGLVHAHLVHSLHEPLVELPRPNQPWPLHRHPYHSLLLLLGNPRLLGDCPSKRVRVVDQGLAHHVHHLRVRVKLGLGEHLRLQARLEGDTCGRLACFYGPDVEALVKDGGKHVLPRPKKRLLHHILLVLVLLVVPCARAGVLDSRSVA
mmetsp:Transcript_393/g.1562  ORF Transcript_393/g.1562 Transcript_393/m.1562 type:complete len:261 (-) Transcript_393:64-846(-)